MNAKTTIGSTRRRLRQEDPVQMLDQERDSLDPESVVLLEDMVLLNQMLPRINRDLKPVPAFELPPDFHLVEPLEEQAEQRSGPWFPALAAAALVLLAIGLVQWLVREEEGIKPDFVIRSDGQSPQEASAHPLIAAIRGEDLTQVAALLEGGNLLQLRDHQNRTPLMEAVAQDVPQIVQLLIDNGADIDASENRGQTALMIAAARGNLDSLNILIEAGANLELTDADGQSALALAEKYQFKECIARLRAGRKAVEP